MTIFDYILVTMGGLAFLVDLVKWSMLWWNPLIILELRLGMFRFITLSTAVWFSSFMVVSYRLWG